MAGAPSEPEPGGVVGASLGGRDQRRHRCEMVGVRRVPQAEQDRDDGDEDERRAVRVRGEKVVETEHVSSLSGVPAQSWLRRR